MVPNTKFTPASRSTGFNTGDSVPWWCGVCVIPQKNGFHGCVHPSQKNPPKVGSWHRSVKLSVRIHLETRKPKRVPKEKSPQDFGAMTVYLWCIMILRNCHFIEKMICYQISAYKSILWMKTWHKGRQNSSGTAVGCVKSMITSRCPCCFFSSSQRSSAC